MKGSVHFPCIDADVISSSVSLNGIDTFVPDIKVIELEGLKYR